MGAILTCRVSLAKLDLCSKGLCCITLPPEGELRKAARHSGLCFDQRHDPDHRNTDLLELLRTPDRSGEELEAECKQESKRESRGGATGAQQEPIGRIRVIGQIGRFD